ncbi:MAG: hypothetical protein A2600_07805 [Candidatus Lambdaproteobacteria bacterium RIFOXYD1_FULL_56_27]|uniref:Uncharacterized protein n=1 Tax=Candidatus Lambdaproteobacteria bacterium RIFOXYD2_FULL_56_26 TaxID=1817773 RepID=A0A1F6GNI2_9PROT|nr:MAG: hypothetical protein A2557_06030 [Candidatus Lambdaproteobacteria bacterium RIFOXYD2_FULL_56_26]OGG99862.1 MAG: hypothetical protein A2426_09760 [Candidatus Lambdaproteobacteria bacterium RIFOXYC1_FULL_56_13]OGH09677.1 MAG: hypothetical protein A2600_07805 [Candidatus Lambdaproteobacteria bacterium RIFOXYD1_FULL_56_27]
MSGYQQFLYLHMVVHLLVALPLLFLGWKGWGAKGVGWGLAGTFGIDSDHFFRLFLHPSEFWDRLLAWNLFDGERAPFLLFHSFELAFVLMLVGWIWKDRLWPFLVVGAAFFVHLSLDMGTYALLGLHPAFYTWTGWVLGLSKVVWGQTF